MLVKEPSKRSDEEKRLEFGFDTVVPVGIMKLSKGLLEVMATLEKLCQEQGPLELGN